MITTTTPHLIAFESRARVGGTVVVVVASVFEDTSTLHVLLVLESANGRFHKQQPHLTPSSSSIYPFEELAITRRSAAVKLSPLFESNGEKVERE
jgi:hypothetical protein